MRDPRRIRTTLAMLRVAWELEPDWRLGQLISNLLGPGPHDVFHPEDNDWSKLIKKFIDARVDSDGRHRMRHQALHEDLDELVADMIDKTDHLPSKTSVMELMEWSHGQSINPT